MSIYPVKIKEWYTAESFKKEMPLLKTMLKFIKCKECGNKVTVKNGWVMHSITFGGPDGAWCSEKCLNKKD